MQLQAICRNKYLLQQFASAIEIEVVEEQQEPHDNIHLKCNMAKSTGTLSRN